VRASACCPSSRSTRIRPSAPARELDRAVEARQHRVEPARLQRRLARQLRAGDPGREAEVVLDPRARTGLAAGRPRLGHQRPQSLGPSVHGGREARGTAAEHDEVEPLAVDLRAQPELPGDLGRRWVAQHGGVAHEDRRLLARDLQPVEHRGAVVVGVDVVPAHGDEVALEQVAHLEGAPRAARRDEPQHAVPVPLVPFPARHHRAQDQLGELGPRGEHRPQRRAVEGDHVGRLVGDALGDRRLPGEGRDVPEERPRVRLRDPDVLARLAIEHPHPAALDDEERGVTLPLLVQRLPGRERPARPQLREPLELPRGHARIHELVAEIGEALGTDLPGCRSLDGHLRRGSRTPSLERSIGRRGASPSLGGGAAPKDPRLVGGRAGPAGDAGSGRRPETGGMTTTPIITVGSGR
jgi:hypothetical protein